MKKTLLFKAPSIIIPRKAAGEFTNSALVDTVLKAEEFWTNSAQANVYKSNAAAALAVFEHQTATFTVLDDKEKDREVRVNWINPCGVTDQACTSDCDLTGPELETGVKNYAFDMCREVPFSVNAHTLRTSIYDVQEVAAKGLAQAVKKLDEYWAQQAILKMKAFSGINVAPLPFTWNAGDLTTEVAAADYNFSMVAPLIKQAMLNQMNSPYYVEKGELFIPYTNAQLEAMNADGKGGKQKADFLDLTFDMFNFDKAGVDETMFAIDAGAMAIQTYNRYPDAPTQIIDQTHYSISSQLLPGVKYGVIYQLTCVTVGNRAQYKHTWKVVTEGGIWQNPNGCPVTIEGVSYNPTGIMSYTKGA